MWDQVVVRYNHNPWPILYNCIELTQDILAQIELWYLLTHQNIYYGLGEIVRHCLTNLQYVSRNMVFSNGRFYPDLHRLEVAENFEFYYEVLEEFGVYSLTRNRMIELLQMVIPLEAQLNALYNFQQFELPF